MKVRVGSQWTQPEGKVVLQPGEDLVVSGPGVTDVWWEQLPLTPHGAHFVPSGPLGDQLRKGAWSGRLTIRQASKTFSVRVERAPLRMSAADLAAMRESLADLAASFEDIGVFTETEVPGSRRAGQGGLKLERHDWLGLHEVLLRHLPPLLDKPLQVQRLEVGPTPACRARPGPRSTLAWKLRGAQAPVLAAHAVQGGSPSDYGWLAGLVRELGSHARERRRRRAEIDGAIKSADPWIPVQRDCQTWLRHPELSGRRPSGPPTWVLSRDVHGSRIMRAADRAGAVVGTGAAGSTRLARLQVADQAHLYELWMILSVVEVLRANFGFRFADGEPQRFRDYATFESGRARLVPMRLVRVVEGPAPGMKHTVRVTLEHEPCLPTKSGGHLTPDLLIRVSATGPYAKPPTSHIVDAKHRHELKRSTVVQTCLYKYQRRLQDAPTAAFVVAPGAEADLEAFMQDSDRRYGNNYGAEAIAHTQPPIYGLAFGSLCAAPVTAPLGIRQLLTVILQYHRSELRHVCGRCGSVATLQDIRLERTTQGHEANASGDARLDAHFDLMVSEYGEERVAGHLLRYRCASCSYEWARHRCGRGHVLMKHGELTPHVRLDGDFNVICSACGHSLARQ